MTREELVTALKSEKTQNLIGEYCDFLNIMEDAYASVLEESVITEIKKYAESNSLLFSSERNCSDCDGIYDISINNTKNETEFSITIKYELWNEVSFGGDIENIGLDGFYADFCLKNSDAEVIDDGRIEIPNICTENAEKIRNVLKEEIDKFIKGEPLK